METRSAASPAATSGTPVRSALGITGKVFLSMAAIVSLAILGSIAWGSLRANQLMDQAVRRSFDVTESAFQSLEKSRYDKLERLTAFVAGDPTLFAVITDTDAATLQDDLVRRKESLGCDFAFVTDADGILLGSSDPAEHPGQDLSDWPLVAAATEGKPSRSILSRQGRLFHAVTVPIGAAGEELLGVLVSGYAIDDAVAAEIGRGTQTEVAFVALEDGKPQLVATTRKDPAELSSLLGFALPRLAAAGEAAEQVELGGESYLGRVSALTGSRGEKVGGLVVLRSIAAELATFRKLRTALLAVGLVALLFAFLVSYLLAHRITRPLLGLVKVARSVEDGNYATEVPEGGADEVGSLSRAIRSMVRELREKAELERYVAGLAMGSTDTVDLSSAPTAAAPPATQGSGPGAAPRAAGGREPRVGELVAGRYEVLGILGTGGMGKVYKVRDRELDEVVALKAIRADLLGGGSGALDRFKQEIKLARKATHRNILRTFDFGDAGGYQYLTMEYVQGLTLRDMVRRQPRIPIHIGLRIARQICTGLAAAHEAHIVHRDVKSNNILIQPNGEVRVMDFGIARPRESAGLTSDGAIVGTPEFMAPEQALGKEVDHRADIYAAGVVFYELFTGKVPFQGGGALEVAMKQVKEAPRPPRELRPDLPPPLEAVILKMLAKEPAARHQSFAQVWSQLSRVAEPARAA